jgi:isochorismate pyruvate lyase
MKKPDECESIEEIRGEIDRIDQIIVSSIAERQEYVRAIVGFKRTQAEIHAQERQKQMIEVRRHWAEELELDPEMIERIFRTLIDHFIAGESQSLSEREDG